MAVFGAGLVPIGPAFDAEVTKIRGIIAGNKDIKKAVDANVAATAPQTESEFKKARGEAVKRAMLDNDLFRRAVNSQVPNTI